MFAAALLGTPRLCRWAPDVPSAAEPLFDLEPPAPVRERVRAVSVLIADLRISEHNIFKLT